MQADLVAAKQHAASLQQELDSMKAAHVESQKATHEALQRHAAVAVDMEKLNAELTTTKAQLSKSSQDALVRQASSASDLQRLTAELSTKAAQLAQVSAKLTNATAPLVDIHWNLARGPLWHCLLDVVERLLRVT